MDYDMVREANQQELLAIGIEALKVKEEVIKSIKPAEIILKELNRVISGQAELDNNINLMVRQVASIGDQLKTLNERKAQWEMKEFKMVKMAAQIEKLKLLEEHKKKLKGNKTVFFNEADAQEARKENHREVFSTIFQKRIKDDNKKCDTLHLYQDTPYGDGLIGKYYNNEFLQGKYIQRIDDEIDFDWIGFSPHININMNNYSVKWEGYLEAPSSQDYIFTTYCDDGIALVLNNKLLIAHNLHSIADESLKRTQQWLDSVLQSNMDSSNDPEARYRSSSKPIRLVAGSRYKYVYYLL